MNKIIFFFLFLIGASTLTSCRFATSNVQTLVTDDCGVTWKLIKAGESVPRGIAACHYVTTIPDYPMQGDCKFKSNFKDRVLANIEVSYDYSIVDGMKFIGEAKYLGKSNSESEDESNSSKKFETAENSVIDKRIRESVSTLLINEDIVEFDQAEFEDKLLVKVNEMLKPLGVQLNFLSFVPVPSEQTKQAIDVATAWKIYESKGLQDVGKNVMNARAGASKIVVESKAEAEESK